MRRRRWAFSTRRRALAAAVTAAILLVGTAIGWLLDTQKPPLTGRAVAVDGDTLRFGRERARLVGLDAPELDQTCLDQNGGDWPCGEAARDFVRATIRAADLACVRQGTDRYGRALVRCSIGEGDLGQVIVAAGWAVAELEYKGPEAEARAAHRGIWVGRFVAPADWRKDEAGNRLLGVAVELVWLVDTRNRFALSRPLCR